MHQQNVRGILSICVALLPMMVAGQKPNSPAPVRAHREPAKIVPLPEVEKRGTGEKVLILIPCFSCGWWSFEPFMERNTVRYTMYAVTLPGHGGTAVPDLPRNTAGTPWHDNAVAALSELVDKENLKDVTIIGHFFGTRIGLEFAAARPDVVTRYIALDATPNSPRGWFKDDMPDRLKAAQKLVENQTKRFANPRNWSNFNRSSRLDPDRRQLYHGMFMSTSKDVVLQYWRENLIKDLNPLFRGLQIPVLDVDAISLSARDPEKSRQQHLESLKTNGTPPNLKVVFVYETSHFIHEHRPELMDKLVWDFVSDREIRDFRPDGYTSSVPKPKDLPLTKEERARYLGTYMAITGKYTVAEADGKLQLQRFSAKYDLLYQGNNTFVRANNPRLTIRFEMKGNRATALTYTSPGKGLNLWAEQID